jgi:phosphoesterase RecJ-like protein
VNLKGLIKQYDRFVITSHTSPDGDALGSCLGLDQWLQEQGKQSAIVLSELPRREFQLPGSHRILSLSPWQCDFALFVLDSSQPDRIGNDLVGISSYVVNVDHHPTNSLFGDWQVVDAGASSTAEILAILISREYQISRSCAQYFYYGILADTGGFRFSNTSARSLEAASLLVNCGAQPEIAAQAFFSNLSSFDMKLLGQALLQQVYEEPIAWTVLPFASGISSNIDTDFIMNIWRQWLLPSIYILFKEIEPGLYKVSMRGDGSVDLSAIAQQFGGGGHKAASGCTMQGHWIEVRTRLLDTIRRAIRDGSRIS